MTLANPEKAKGFLGAANLLGGLRFEAHVIAEKNLDRASTLDYFMGGSSSWGGCVAVCGSYDLTTSGRQGFTYGLSPTLAPSGGVTVSNGFWNMGNPHRWAFGPRTQNGN